MTEITCPCCEEIDSIFEIHTEAYEALLLLNEEGAIVEATERPSDDFDRTDSHFDSYQCKACGMDWFDSNDLATQIKGMQHD